MESEGFQKGENIMENKEMIKTTIKSKGLFVGVLVAATAAVGTLIYKKSKRNKVEIVAEPQENIFKDIIEDEKQ